MRTGLQTWKHTSAGLQRIGKNRHNIHEYPPQMNNLFLIDDEDQLYLPSIIYPLNLFR